MKSEDLTVLVFKDNSAARTFRVPLSWLSKLGLMSGAVGAAAVLGLFLSVKYYIAARHALKTADPAYVQDLEQEIASLRAAKAPAQSVEAPAPAPVVSAVAPMTQVAPIALAPTPAPVPAPTVTVTVTPTAAAPPPVTTLAFTALPTSVKAAPASADNSTVSEPRVSWLGRKLLVQFFIHYVREDKGSQQGRIVLLARGGDTLLAYPSGVLNTDEKSSLVSPEKGEYFSVSRIREVKAEFGPMKSNNALKSVEVFLFGNDGRLLIHQMLLPGAEHAPDSSEAPTSGTSGDTPEENTTHEEENNTNGN
jgi:hypothetical protein